MVDREIEESLDLVGMEVAGHHPVCARGFQEVCDELGSDGYAGTVLPVLARPAEIGHHGDHLVGGSPLGGVDGEQELHQVVSRREGGLDDEDGRSTHALGKGGLELTVAERGHNQVAEPVRSFPFFAGSVQLVNDFGSKIFGCPAGKQFDAVFFDHDYVADNMDSM